MFQKWIQKMANNGQKCKPDLGQADALEAEDELYRVSEETEAAEPEFEEQATKLDQLTKKVRRVTDPLLHRKENQNEKDHRRDSGIIRAEG